jgi:hypothetical protein
MRSSAVAREVADMNPSQINSVARGDVFMMGTVVGAEIYRK